MQQLPALLRFRPGPATAAQLDALGALMYLAAPPW